eukprot:1690584-Amphidinium_carterae.1
MVCVQLAIPHLLATGRMFPVSDFYWEDACEWIDYCPPDKGSKGGKGGKGATLPQASDAFETHIITAKD